VHRTRTRGLIIIGLALLVVVFSSTLFATSQRGFEIYPSPYLSQTRLLSDYNPNLAGTAGDTEVLFFEGKEPGGTLLVIGGTHADEPAGVVSALLFAENVKVTHGRLIVIPFANRSAFTHNLPQEAHPPYYTLETLEGERIIKYGSRVSNSIHQWPDPTVYVQQVDGQKLAGVESRNLNRAYPGTPKGSLTSRVAYGIVELIKQEGVDVAIDLHESSPEYPVNNAIVAHDRAMEMAVFASLELSMDGVEIGIEPSPVTLRGLSHREWGDNTPVYAFLLESANAAQGRLRGQTNAELVTSGRDPMYVLAKERGRLYVQYPDEGISISVRAGRHVATVQTIAAVYSEFHPDRPISFEGIPTYHEIVDRGVGTFLSPSRH
jgi:hypothetical protein